MLCAQPWSDDQKYLNDLHPVIGGGTVLGAVMMNGMN